MRASRRDAGFTLIEVLLATLLMTVILGAMATVTAQWLPNWNRGMARVQRAERLATGIDRISADLAAAEMVPLNGAAGAPLFDGTELAVTFIRTAVGPNARPGLEIVRLIEKADAQGLALVRERTPLVPMADDAQLRFSDAVVLVRAPFRISLAYAGPDHVWQPAWRGRMELPAMVRITVRDGATGRTLSASTATLVHTNAPAECARAKSAAQCLKARLKPEEASL